jgi:signal transduction histidine kinase
METEPQRKRPKVLVVDDTAVARSFIHRLLAAEHDLIEASGGREALEKIAQDPPDVVLLDMVMPEVDGIAVCTQVKGDPRTRNIPVIMMTSMNRTEERVRSLDAGADDFLPKPFEGVELLARLRSMLRIKSQFDELETAVRQREQLSQMIVHDLRSPLTSMTLALDVLDQSSLPDDARLYVRQVGSDLRRINGFLTELLAVAKMDAGQLILARTPISVPELLEQVVASHQILAKVKGTTILLDLAGDFPHWPLDGVVFQRVVDNLLSNAIKFSPRNKEIVVRVTYPLGDEGTARRLRLDVADRGAGVPPKYQGQLFNRFHTFGGGDRSVQQIGLGLAFCKMAIEAHGGAISYAANEPQGSIFTVEVPSLW